MVYNRGFENGGGTVSLRKSPTLTPALLASNRRNAKKSTGPRTARGKAQSRLNRLKEGWHSPTYINFLKALLDAPPGQVSLAAKALLKSQPVRHPLFLEAAELSVQAEIAICEENRLRRTRVKEKENSLFARSKPECF
jgi:hypothetical protein